MIDLATLISSGRPNSYVKISIALKLRLSVGALTWLHFMEYNLIAAYMP